MLMDLHEDLLEDSDRLYHRDVATLQLQMFEELRQLKRRLLQVANFELILYGMPHRERIVRATNEELNRTWDGIRLMTSAAIGKLREEKEERDRNIRGYVPSR